MTVQPALLTLRTFLAEQGAAPAPWSGPTAAVDALASLTQARRGDPRYIARLQRLAQDLRPQLAVDGALDAVAVERLVQALRSPSPQGRLPQATAAALTLVALAACGKAEDTGGADEACAGASEMAAEEADTYCALIEAIEGSSIPSRDDLLTCLAATDAGHRESLEAALAGKSEAEIAEILQAYYDSEPECGYEDCGNCH